MALGWVRYRIILRFSDGSSRTWERNASSPAVCLGLRCYQRIIRMWSIATDRSNYQSLLLMRSAIVYSTFWFGAKVRSVYLCMACSPSAGIHNSYPTCIRNTNIKWSKLKLFSFFFFYAHETRNSTQLKLKSETETVLLYDSDFFTE